MMLDQQGRQNLFNHTHSLWIEPELARRRDAGKLPEDFKIRQCLIKLPRGGTPIVEFNEEISWKAKPKPVDGAEIKEGQPVLLQQVQYIETVYPPTHDGKRVGFVFLFWTGLGWRIIFDLSAQGVDGDHQGDDESWSLGAGVADHLNHFLKELTVNNIGAVHADVRSIGLWAAPALLPYPLSAICELCRNGQSAEACDLLVKHCDASFIQMLVERWSELRAFAVRSQLFADAFQAHRDEKYTLSISSLIPQIEGVVTDWVYTQLPADDVPWRQEAVQNKGTFWNGINLTQLTSRAGLSGAAIAVPS
jgi:hypothetical protein